MQEYFNERLSQETHQLQINMSKKIQEALNQQNSNSNTTRSSIKERQTVLESLSNNKKLETALNQWMERVEEQVQAIDETLNDKASLYEL